MTYAQTHRYRGVGAKVSPGGSANWHPLSSTADHNPRWLYRLVDILLVVLFSAPAFVYVVMDGCARKAEHSAWLAYYISSLILLVSLVLHSILVTLWHPFCNNLAHTTHLVIQSGFYLSVDAYFALTSYFFKVRDTTLFFPIMAACIMWVLLATASLVELHVMGCPDKGFHPELTDAELKKAAKALKKENSSPRLTNAEWYRLTLLILDIVHWSMFFMSYLAAFWFIWGQLLAKTVEERGVCN